MGYAKKKTFKNSILSALPLLARRSPFQARPEVAIFWDLKSPYITSLHVFLQVKNASLLRSR